MTIAVKSPQDFTHHPASLRDAMRHLAGGVSVITAGIGEDRTGLTVTSAISLSVEPPTMIICVNRGASSWPVIRKYRHFCVNILGSLHQGVAERFSGRGGIKGPARYDGATWKSLVTEASVLDDAVASIDCEVEEFIERHSHAIVIGAVKAISVNGGEPLVYGRGRYGAFA